MQLTLYTGAGSPVTLTTSGGNLCDGQWRSLTMVQNGPQVTLSVLGGPIEVGSGDSSPLVITSELFMGGIPDESAAADFVEEAGLSLQSGLLPFNSCGFFL